MYEALTTHASNVRKASTLNSGPEHVKNSSQKIALRVIAGTRASAMCATTVFLRVILAQTLAPNDSEMNSSVPKELWMIMIIGQIFVCTAKRDSL